MPLAILDIPADAIKLDIVSLTHPGTGQPVNMALAATPSGNQLMELVNCASADSSWFVGQAVQKHGGLMLCTRLDCNLLALSTLDSNRDRFSPLAQVLHPHASILQSCAGLDVSLYCDVDTVGSVQVVRLNEAKAVTYLSGKVAKAQAHLQAQLERHPEGLAGRAAGFERPEVLSGDEIKAATAESERRALQVVCDYLPERLRRSLVESRGRQLSDVLAAAPIRVAAAECDAAAPGTTWEEANGYIVPMQDSTVYTMGAKKSAEESVKRVKIAAPQSASQKKKIEKAAKGSMKIASFFKPVEKEGDSE